MFILQSLTWSYHEIWCMYSAIFLYIYTHNVTTYSHTHMYSQAMDYFKPHPKHFCMLWLFVVKYDGLV